MDPGKYELEIMDAEGALVAIDEQVAWIRENLKKLTLAARLVDRMKNPARCEKFLQDNAFMKHGSKPVFWMEDDE